MRENHQWLMDKGTIMREEWWHIVIMSVPKNYESANMPLCFLKRYIFGVQILVMNFSRRLTWTWMPYERRLWRKHLPLRKNGTCVNWKVSWRWRHDWETLSALLALCEGNPPVTGEFPSQRTSNLELWCCHCVSLKKMLNKQSSCRWFQASWYSLLTWL